MREYFVMNSQKEAIELIEKIDSAKGFKGTCGEPIAHPINEKFLIRFDRNSLCECKSIWENEDIVDKHKAFQAGWYLGPFNGKLAREKEKMEDIHCLFGALAATYGKPNFPVFRALLLSFLSACYSLKESIKKKANLPNSDTRFEHWWLERNKEISATGSLLQCYEQFMNNEKHGGANANQIPPLSIYSKAILTSFYVMNQPLGADLNSLELSEEGAFVTVDIGTPMERRVPIGIHEARYDVVVENPPSSHLNQPIIGLPFMSQMELIRNYYALLLFNAKNFFGEGVQNTPAMVFQDGARGTISPNLDGK
jgi:hypothetical protein